MHSYSCAVQCSIDTDTWNIYAPRLWRRKEVGRGKGQNNIKYDDISIYYEWD
jgi:hypothetical protein